MIVVIQIEGVGDKHGLWRFVTRQPYSTPQDRMWFPKGHMPTISGQEVPPHGGCVTQGETSFELVDVGDQLTQSFAHESPPIGQLVSGIAAGSPTLTLTSNTGFYPGQVIAIDRECIRLNYIGFATTWNVTRGFLGTDDADHGQYGVASNVYPVLPYIAGRRVWVYVGDGLAQSTEVAQGAPGWLDPPELSADLTTWKLTSRSMDRVLDAKVIRAPIKDSVVAISGNRVLPRHPTYWADKPPYWIPHVGNSSFARADDSIMRLQHEGAHLVIDVTGVGSTKPLDPSKGYQFSTLEQVFVCDPAEPNASFRYQSPGSEVATTFGESNEMAEQWSPTAHPIPVILAMLLSGHPDNTANYVSGKGNYACLPEGVGLGLSANEVDWDAAHATWGRIPRASVPYFVLDSDTTARDVIDQIARYCGITVGWVGQKLTFITRSTPTGDDTIHLSDIVAKGGVPQIGRPRYEYRYLATRVVTRAKDADGNTLESTFNLADFPELFGVGVFGDTFDLTLDVPFVRVESYGDEPEFLRSRALALLSTFRRPLWSLTLDLPLEWRTRVFPGQTVYWGHPQMPDLGTGRRGQSPGTLWLVLRSDPVLSDGVCRLTLLSYGFLPPGGIVAPSARIASVAGAVATVSANRYTDPDNVLGLPTTDASAFKVGDVVHLRLRSGAVIATTPTSGTVDAISGNNLTLSTDFGGAMAAGVIIEYIDSASALVRQLQTQVYLCASATGLIGSTGRPGWRFRAEEG